MSDTPETDAMADWYLGASLLTDPDQKTVPVALSRKLERERDEWRKAAFEITSQANKLKIQLKSERDEAREQLNEWRVLNLWGQGGREMSDTPETDKLLGDLLAELGSLGRHNCPEKLVIYARRLERERDAALEMVDSSIHSCHDECQRPMCVLRRERDEARALAEERKGYWEDSVKEYEALRSIFQKNHKELNE